MTGREKEREEVKRELVELKETLNVFRYLHGNFELGKSILRLCDGFNQLLEKGLAREEELEKSLKKTKEKLAQTEKELAVVLGTKQVK